MPPPRKTTRWFPPGRFQELYDRTEGACGSPDPFECWLLSKLAEDARSCILEIGSWRGRSASFLAECSGVRVVCVDHFEGDTTGGGGPDEEAFWNAVNGTDGGAEGLVTLVKSDMLKVDWGSVLPSPPDLVFYDADHTKGATVKCLTVLAPHLAPDCRVAVHDASFPETREALNELTAGGRLYRRAVFVEVWEGLEIIQRV